MLFLLFLLFPPVPLFSHVSSCFSFFLLFLVFLLFFFFILFLLFLCSQPRTLVFLSATESSRGEQQVILTNCFKQLFALFPSTAGSTPWRGREEPPVFAANHALCSANLTVTHNTTSRNTHCNTQHNSMTNNSCSVLQCFGECHTA